MIGPCQYLTCSSVIGTDFRATFAMLDGRSKFTEALLCPEHARLCEQLRRDIGIQLMLSPEGWIYPRMWLEAMGFVT